MQETTDRPWITTLSIHLNDKAKIEFSITTIQGGVKDERIIMLKWVPLHFWLSVSQPVSQSVSQLVRVQLYLASPSLFIKSFRPMIAWLVATAAPRYRPLTQTTSLVSHRLWSSLLSLLSIDIFINQENKVNESERWHFWKYYNGESHVPL